MEYKKITTSENKDIHIFDNMFPHTYRSYLYTYATNSRYQITGSVTPAKEHWNEWNLSCHLVDHDLANVKFDEYTSLEYKQLVDNRRIDRAFILLSHDRQFTRWHTDGLHFKYTVLYYANLKWDVEWGGETVFSNENFSDIEAAVLYKPGRVVVFDSSIPHKACNISPDAPQIRMIYSFNYRKTDFKYYNGE